MKLYRERWMYIITTLFLMYLLTVLLLLVLTLMVYKLDLAEWIAQLGVTLVYVVSGYFGGFLLGKRIRHQRFFWGMGIGGLYFVTLLIASLVANGGALKTGWVSIFVFILCTFSAVCGEMTRK